MQQTFIPLNKSFPATANLPDRWSFVEEVYYFRSDPRSNGAVVVMTVDEGSYTSASLLLLSFRVLATKTESFSPPKSAGSAVYAGGRAECTPRQKQFIEQQY